MLMCWLTLSNKTVELWRCYCCGCVLFFVLRFFFSKYTIILLHLMNLIRLYGVRNKKSFTSDIYVIQAAYLIGWIETKEFSQTFIPMQIMRIIIDGEFCHILYSDSHDYFERIYLIYWYFAFYQKIKYN